MIDSKKEAQGMLRDALATELDDVLAASSFARRANSLDYTRTCKDGKQKLRMVFTYKPKYQPGASGHIYPQITVVLPELNELAIEMVGGNQRLIGDPNITFSQPIDMVIPKEHHLRWFTTGPATFGECVASIRSSLDTWIVPFLDEYTTIESITTAYESGDDRIMMQRHFYIYIAAAYILQQKPELAKQVLEDKLGRAGPRREYAQAFEYVSGQSAN